jgi:hypothetical protein
MSQVELTARAIARAREQRVHIRRTARPGVYVTCSKSEPGVKYTLVVGDGILACSCKGFEYRKSCKHSEALRNRLAREATRGPQPPTPAAPAARWGHPALRIVPAASADAERRAA